MADYIAHTLFGNRVMEALPNDLRKRCTSDPAAFQMGLYGPDPLIFSFRTKKISDYLHKNWRVGTLPTLEQALRNGSAVASSFAAGYVLHQILDDLVHPRIYAWMEEGSSHFRLEIALDMLILKEKNWDRPPRLQTDGKTQTAQVGASLLEKVSHRQYLSGLWRMAALTEYFRYGGMSGFHMVKSAELSQAQVLRREMEDNILPAADELTKRMERFLPYS